MELKIYLIFLGGFDESLDSILQLSDLTLEPDSDESQFINFESKVFKVLFLFFLTPLYFRSAIDNFFFIFLNLSKVFQSLKIPNYYR